MSKKKKRKKPAGNNLQDRSEYIQTKGKNKHRKKRSEKKRATRRNSN